VREFKDGTISASWALPESEHSVDWHPDGRWLAVGGESGTIRLLDSQDASRPPRTIEAHDGVVVALAFHPGGRLLASASRDGTLRLWDVPSAEQLVRCPLPEARSIRFSQDGRFLGPGLDGASAWSWEVAEGAECRLLVSAEGGGAGSRSVDFLAGTGVLASVGEYGVRMEVPGGGAAALVALPGTIGLAADPDGSFLITSGATGLLRWPVARRAAGDLRLGPPEPLQPLAGLPTGRVCLSRDGRTLAVDGEVGRVVVLDLQGRHPPVILAGHPNLERLDLSPDGRWVATGTWHGNGVKVWDVRRGSLARELAVQGSAEVAFSPDCRWFVTASGEQYAVWDLSSWTRLFEVPRSHAIGLPGLTAFSPTGRVLAIARTRILVQLVDAESGRELVTLEAPEPRNVSALRFSPEGRLLAVAQNVAGVQVWDLEAMRRGLESLRLEWPATTGALPIASPLLIPKQIVIENAPWLAPLAQGEELARLQRWDEAAGAFEEAIASGAHHVEAHIRRVLFRQLRGDETAYREACRPLLRMFEPSELVPRVAHDIAWACALGSGAVADYAPVVHLAEAAAASRRSSRRLTTLGAVLYRAGRFEKSIRQLSRAVELKGTDGTPYNALFLAMAHYRLGHANEARRWLRLGTAVDPIAMRTRDATGDTSWIRRLELEILRREARALIEPTHP
jgi:WD40 repeat protein